MIQFSKESITLCKEELERLLYKTKKGDLEARNKIIEHNLRLVMKIVKRFKNSEMEIDDMFSIGVIGLTKGVEKYDLDKYGTRAFSTFVGKCIENELLMQIRKLKNKTPPISFEEEINFQTKSSNMKNVSLEDILATEEISSLDAIYRDQKIQALHKAIKTLTKKEQYILQQYYGIGNIEDLNPKYFYSESFGTNGPTLVQKQIAKNLNTCRSNVTKMLKTIHEKLRKELESYSEFNK